jgi:hypothetical protein
LMVGAMAMADGTAPVARLTPFALIPPVEIFTTKAETLEFACAVTNSRPEPPPFAIEELLLLQAIKQRSKTGSSTCCRKRNFIRILSPCRRFKISHNRAGILPRHTVGDQGLPSFVYQDYKGSANLAI